MDSDKRTIAIVAIGHWSAALTNGAMRVVLPVYFAAAGGSISKIAFLFFLFKLAEVVAPMGMGLTLNRLGYKRTFVSALGIHTLISCFFLFPASVLVFFERFVRGIVYMTDLSAVYIKHFSSREKQRFFVNLILGLKEASKGVGMVTGGLLLTVLTLQKTIIVFAAVTAASTFMAMRFLPDLRERSRTPVRKIWRAVDGKIKTLGWGFGLLNGALDAWGVVILPVYLTTVFGLSPGIVGTVMMTEYVFHGVVVSLFSRYINIPSDARTILVMTALALIAVCLILSVPLPLSTFLVLVFVYLFFFSVSMVYYNHLRLEFASEVQTSLDLATFTTLSNVFKPIAVLASGLLVESFGLSWAFYFAALLTLFSALTCLWLPRAAARSNALLGSYEAGVL